MPTVNPAEGLPLSLFHVLEEEFVAIHGPLPPDHPTWDVAADQIDNAATLVSILEKAAAPDASGSVSAFARRLVTLAKRIDGGWTRNLSVEGLPAALNTLLLEPTLYGEEAARELMLRDETREIARVHFDGTQMNLLPDDMRRFNRLLLEDAFPKHLRSINDIRMAAISAKIHLTPTTALCFSGGGIRSGTFSLGVLQGLARRGLLDRFHYLSTVSGGGYIGSWLTAWAHRHKDGLRGVIADLTAPAGSKLDPEPEPLRHLREYSNFVAPRPSLVSADLWSFVAIYFRNLLINWAALIPILLGVLLVPRILIALLYVPDPPRWISYPLLGLGFLFSVAAVLYVTANRPSRADLLTPGSWLHAHRDQGSFLRYSLTPTIAAGLCLSIVWAWYQAGKDIGLPGWPGWLNDVPASCRLLIVTVALGVAIYSMAVVGASILLRHLPSIADCSAVLFTGAGGGLITWILVWTLFDRPAPGRSALSLTAAWYACLALPAYLLVFFGAATVFVAATSKRRSLSWNAQWFAIEDEDREWIARHSAWLLIVALGWAVGTGLVVFGPLLLLAAPKILAALGGISGAVSILGGKSGLTPATDKSESAPGWKTILLQNALSIAAMLFLALFIAALSLLTSWALALLLMPDTGQLQPPPTGLIHGFWTPEQWAGQLGTLYFSPACLLGLGALLAIGAGLLASWIINLNKFSLHAAYRGRIIRAFLGASRPAATRVPNPFTGFDPQDNIQMHELRPGLLREASFKPGGLLRLIVRLRDSQGPKSDAPSKALYTKLSAATKAMIARHRDRHPPSQSLKRNLLEDINLQLDGDPGLLALAPFADLASSDSARGVLTPLIARERGELPAASSYRDLANQLPVDGRINSLLVLNRSMLDSVYPADLEPLQGPPPPYKLLHVIGVALNLVRGNRLAWQQRRAESFTVSPLHCGSLYRGYRRSRAYGGPDGISLGTAVTISGAAVSSNMGYHSSSAAVTFALTLFNARLGWWLGNPGVAGGTWPHSGPSTVPPYRRAFPRMSLSPLVLEAFGLTDDTSSYVLLSDGGHFDNLGLYEMVLRRCRFIVAVDGSQDENTTFDDLGAAVRKIRIDLGINIVFKEPMGIYRKERGATGKEPPSHYCAVATIHYPDGSGQQAGVLLYIKPAILGGEPRDILQYAAANPAFPHQTTLDQLFDESQFESYRKLGEHVASKLCEKLTGTAPTLAQFVASIYRGHLEQDPPPAEIGNLVNGL